MPTALPHINIQKYYSCIWFNPQRPTNSINIFGHIKRTFAWFNAEYIIIFISKSWYIKIVFAWSNAANITHVISNHQCVKIIFEWFNTANIAHVTSNHQCVRIIFAWSNAVGVVLLVAQGWRGTSLPWVNYRRNSQRCRRCTFYNMSQPHKYIMQNTTQKTYNTYGVASYITRFNPG